MTLAHAGTRAVGTGYGTDWLYLLVPLLVIAAVIAYLVASGNRTDGRTIGFIPRAAASLERVTGMPAWSAGGVLMGAGALVIAVIGFLWDVAWHIDFGRDEFIFTPAHTMILIGLFLLVVAAATAAVLATVTRADVGVVVKGVRIPYSALALGALGAGALCGFPLDELWHGAYGVDVTMWGPTHLLMIGGASFSPIALFLMTTEAGPEANEGTFAKIRRVALGGAMLIGLSTFQGEFDFGVPQFQQLYHPVLISLAMALGLVASREALGRWGALKAVAFFIGARAALSLLIGQALNHVIPRFPLYVAGAICVELVWHFAREARALPRALVAAALVGTIGLAGEWLWLEAWGWHPWNATLFPGIWIAVAIAIPAAIVGLAVGRALAWRPAVTSRALLLASGTAIVVLLALPFPRNDMDAVAEVTTQPAGEGVVDVAVTTTPEITSPDWAEVLAWQGGHMDAIPLVQNGDGTYRAVRPVPVGGEWKTLVRFARKDVLVAAPVYLPNDPAIGASEVPVVERRSIDLVRDTQLLLREANSGPAWPAIVAYLGIALVALTWVSVLSFAFARVNPGSRLRSGTAAGPVMSRASRVA